MNWDNKEETRKNIIEFGRHVFFNNIVIKLLSIVGAALVWIMIVNIDDPYRTKTFVVHVETINEDSLRSVNKVYEIIEGGTATVSVGGKRSIIDNLTSDDIRATADLSELSTVNAVAIKVGLRKSTYSDVDLECNQVLKVRLEEMETKQVKVTVETVGTPAEGYFVGECTVRPNVIEVTGGSSVIDRISTVRVTINVNGASQDFAKRLEPAAYDRRGNRIMSSTMSFSDTTVRVRAKLLQSKAVPVKVEVKGKPADGYELIEAACLPEEIEIAGKEKILAGISEVVIPVNVTGFTNVFGGLEQEIMVADYLDEDIMIPEEYQKVSIKITIEKLLHKKIVIQSTNIQLRNVSEDCVAMVYGNLYDIELSLRGRESELEELPGSMTAYVDCSGLKVGAHTLPIEIDVDNDCKLMKKARVRVIIVKRRPTEVTQTPAPMITPKPEEGEDLPSNVPEE